MNSRAGLNSFGGSALESTELLDEDGIELGSVIAIIRNIENHSLFFVTQRVSARDANYKVGDALVTPHSRVT